MENQQITERTFQFALRIIKLCRALQKEYIGRTLSGQLRGNISRSEHRGSSGSTKHGRFHRQNVHCPQRIAGNPFLAAFDSRIKNGARTKVRENNLRM